MWNGKKIIDEKELPGDEKLRMNIISRKPLGVLEYDNEFADDVNASIYIRKFIPYFVFPGGRISQLSGCLVSADIGNYLIGHNIDSVYNAILQTGLPHSFNTHKKISLSVIKNDVHKKSANIVGIIKGTNEKLPCVVITAHHDHEGKVDGATYYGADDNGSGTTALLEIAKILGDASAKGIRAKRTIVFVSTAAEEQGLIGGYAYVHQPVIPLSNTYCNINIDMLGRVDSFYTNRKADSNYVYFMYCDSTRKIFNRNKLQDLCQKYSPLNLDTLYEKESKRLNSHGLITRSDNFPFMQKGIPSIWFFGGFHKDYHQPTDTPDKINYPLFKRRTQLVLAIVWQLANESQ
jgi:Zn-dependent M28 family amino/carboxypeptidase